MKEIHNPHDRFFRSVFAEIDCLRDLIQSALPQRICDMLDFNSIRLSAESYIDERLSLYQTDILARARLRSSQVLIYILIDHKSYPDRWVVLQLLNYMVRIWEKERSRNPKSSKLPCIIPMIFYHGMRAWNHPLYFSACFESPKVLELYIPEYQALLFNLEEVDVKSLHGSVMFKAALNALKYVLRGLGPYLRELLESLSGLPMDVKSKTFLSRLFEYIIQTSGDLDVQDLERELQRVDSDFPREVFVTIEEQLLERGKAEGKAEGTILGKQQVLLQLLEKKFGSVSRADRQAVLKNKDREKLDRAVDAILDAASIRDVVSRLD